MKIFLPGSPDQVDLLFPRITAKFYLMAASNTREDIYLPPTSDPPSLLKDSEKKRRGRPRKYPEGYKNRNNLASTLPVAAAASAAPTADDTSPSSPSTTFPTSPICPICNSIVPGDETDGAAHVEECLQKKDKQPPRPVAKPVVLDDSLVNIMDGDESQFGRPQYSDRDVASVLSTICASIQSPPSDCPLKRDSVQALIRTVQLQDQIIQRIPRCVICLDPHRKPVVSTVCWHVFCETCWLQSLSSKRVCPNCSTITSPQDLRRVYF